VTLHRAGPLRPPLDALLRRARSHAAHRAGRPFPVVSLVHRSRPQLRRTVVAVAGPVAFPGGPVRTAPGCACCCRTASPVPVGPWPGLPLPARPRAGAGRPGAAPVFRTAVGATVGRSAAGPGDASASRLSGRVAADTVRRADTVGPVGAMMRVPPGAAVSAPWRDLVPRTRYARPRGIVSVPEYAGAGPAGRAPAPPAPLPLVFTRPGSVPVPQGRRHPVSPAVPGNATAGPGSPVPVTAAARRPFPVSAPPSSSAVPPLPTSDVPQLVERVVREIDRRMQARLERRGRP
jgi:hypothetical protein